MERNVQEVGSNAQLRADNNTIFKMLKVRIGEHKIPPLPYSYDALETLY